MLDHAALRAVAAVAQTGSFEKAALSLNVTPSAISQRVKQLEERLGVVLIVRGQPCTATDQGALLCRHVETVGMLEAGLIEQLPAATQIGAGGERVTLRIATNADSLGTWFLNALADFTRRSEHLLDIVVDDQDHTADWLRRGQVVAAVTSSAKLVAGCRRTALGALRFRATASPAFVKRHFPKGVTPAALAQAPAITFNQKDRLQERWIHEVFGRGINHPTHWLPSTQSFVEASLAGMGWGMNPVQLVDGHLRAGRLIELRPDTPIDIPLFWQVNRLSAGHLGELTRAIVTVARRELVQDVAPSATHTHV
ncbi:MAG: Transcriptional regulator, LysR family [Xanthobacteraceae bacterium]|jgi:LysR family transcriptional regulator (chromosome initiation inhibitor)|nr:Transcriptional regulator, LysR family [Xanthobacteraceae bacterium]